jgi:hypothetical protein
MSGQLITRKYSTFSNASDLARVRTTALKKSPAVGALDGQPVENRRLDRNQRRWVSTLGADTATPQSCLVLIVIIP